MKKIFILLAIAYAGCRAPSALVPCLPNTPDFKKQFDGNVNVTGGIDHAEAQASFSPFNHVGLNFNSYLSFMSRQLDKGTNMWQATAGYYRVKSKFGYDVFGGLGSGSRHNGGVYGFWLMLGDNASEAFVNTRFTNALLQADIYSQMNDKWRITFSAQLNHFFLHDFSYTNETAAFNEANWTMYKYRLDGMQQDLLLVSLTFRDQFSDHFSFFLQPGFWACSPLHAQVDSYTQWGGGDQGVYVNDGLHYLNRVSARPFFNTGFSLDLGSFFKPKDGKKKIIPIY